MAQVLLGMKKPATTSRKNRIQIGKTTFLSTESVQDLLSFKSVRKLMDFLVAWRVPVMALNGRRWVCESVLERALLHLMEEGGTGVADGVEPSARRGTAAVQVLKASGVLEVDNSEPETTVMDMPEADGTEEAVVRLGEASTVELKDRSWLGV
jgi:hypothetical protein